MATLEQLQNLEIQRKGYLITPNTNLDFSGNTNNYIGIVTYDDDPNLITSASIATPKYPVDYGMLMLWQLPIGTHYTSPHLGIEYIKVAMPGGNSTMANCWKKIAFDTSIKGNVDKSLYNAYTVLAATTDDNPLPISLNGASTGIAGSVLGRIADAIQSINIDSDLSSVSTNDDTIPSAKAVVTYVNSIVTGSLIFRGGYNVSTDATGEGTGNLINGVVTTNPDSSTFVNVLKGDTYVITVGGTFYNVTLGAGDMIIANNSIASTVPASNRSVNDWTLVIKNIPTIVSASETTEGIIGLASDENVTDGIDDSKAVTPRKLKNRLDKLPLIKKMSKLLANPINGLPASDTNPLVTSFTIPAVSDLTKTPPVIGHDLGTSEISISVKDTTTGHIVEVETIVNSDSSVTINFTLPPDNNRYRVTLIG